MRKEPVIAVVGATGIVGNEMVVVLDQVKMPYTEVRLYASEESAGEVYKVGSEEVEVEVLDEASFQGVDLALFATSAELSAKYVPIAVAQGAVAIDNSSHFRMQEGVPLVVPEVNADTISAGTKIIANPNCSTIQLVPILDVIDRAAGLRRVVVSTYQSVSGAGKHAMDELWEQTLAVFRQQEMPVEHFQHQIAFNCIPQIDLMMEDGYSKEEHKIMAESRKILRKPDLAITATAVRVPVLYGHAESVNVEIERDISPQQLCEILAEKEGVVVYPEVCEFPMQLGVAGSDEIHVGRIRRDGSAPHALNMWIVADNVRKGAALNAVQIAKLLLS